MKIVRTSVTLIVVVAISAAIGVSLGLVVGRAVGQEDGHPLRTSARVGRIVPSDNGTKWHSKLSGSKDNVGPPGTLVVRGTYKVGIANEIHPDALEPFDVLVRIEDMFGNVLVDGDYIGSGVDKPGEGNWEQTFEASYQLPAGKYVVDMLLHNPNKRFRLLDGTVLGPYQVGFSRWTMTVR